MATMPNTANKNMHFRGYRTELVVVLMVPLIKYLKTKMTYFGLKTANFTERWHVCIPLH